MPRHPMLPPLEDGKILISINDLRWMLMAAGDWSRELAIWEVREFGLAHARRTSGKLDRRRKAFARLLEAKQT